ncbi:MAG TPA: hypothetical protein PKW35_15325, partial [Nannocystaceae bacterium]|nr:hypothetical protein [Nannocystaceae bacterium]
MCAVAHRALAVALLLVPTACTEPTPYLNVCGDGVLEPMSGEECDDGASGNDDRAACTSTCQLRPRPTPLHRTMTRSLPRSASAPLLAALIGCQPTPGDTSGFTSAQPSTSAPASTSADSTSQGTTTAATSTASTTTAAWTTEVATGVTASTTLILDVGTDKDIGDPKPPGCQGKIDFLFVISRAPNMEARQAKLIAAFPHFIDTIQAKFADFDFHIMVVDGDPEWGSSVCTNDCPVLDCKVGQPCCPLAIPPNTPGDPCCSAPNYPCSYLDDVTVCDETIGAGNVIAAGPNAANKICPIAGGHRYLTKDQPNLVSTFSCAAQLG